MAYILLAFFLFIVSIMAHVFFCRITKKPGLHAKAFVFIAIILLCVYGVIVSAWQYFKVLDPNSLWGMPFIMTAGIMFILLVPIYLCFYVLTQLTSPSKKILSSILQGGEVSYDDILVAVRKEDFITTRLNDLCASSCVMQRDGRYILTAEGREIAVILDFMQIILGRKAGG